MTKATETKPEDLKPDEAEPDGAAAVEPAFKPGDVVVLKSGGPKMTVEAIKGDKVRCVWMDTVQCKHEFDFVAAGLNKKG